VIVASAAIGYLIGSLPFGYLAARRLADVDLRRVGSGNVGATNVLRVLGPALGVLVMAADMAKGAAAVALAGGAAAASDASVTAGVAAVAGHMFPIWLGGRGGKGVATACGAFALLAPVATIVAAGVFVSAVWLTRLVSLGSIAATVSLPVAAAATGYAAPVVNGSMVAAAAIVWQHRGNLVRLWRGSERRLGQPDRSEPRA
jgi:acyl phosphate:glycerol-3-phosphate acyltransferase